MKQHVDIDFLLPNGFCLTLNIDKYKLTTLFWLVWLCLIQLHYWRELTLNEIRCRLYEEATSQFGISFNQKHAFSSVNDEANLVEFYDFEKKLVELPLFSEFPFFRLVQAECEDLDEKLLSIELSNACGLGIDEIEALHDEELIEYRMELLKVVRSRLVDEIDLNARQTNSAAFHAIYAPNLEIDSTQLKLVLNSQLNESLVRKSFVSKLISVKIFQTDNKMEARNFSVPIVYTPDQVIAYFLRLVKREALDDKRQNMVLHICGCDEILYGSCHKLTQYKVNFCLQFILVSQFAN